MTCEICNGDERYLVADHRSETMVWVDCMDCMLNNQYREHLLTEVSKKLMSQSHESLAQLLAEVIVNSVESNEKDSLDRILEMTKQKQGGNELRIVAECYTEWMRL